MGDAKPEMPPNPPFSQNDTYQERDENSGELEVSIPHPERFRIGWCPENGKKADLMFIQHMLAVLRERGMAATMMSQGVLFRGGHRAGHPGQNDRGRPARGGERSSNVRCKPSEPPGSSVESRSVGSGCSPKTIEP